MNLLKHNGSSMIEILVAIVITVIGLLGVASLQGNALKYQKTSAQKSESMQSIYDLGERMRANAIAARDGAYIYTVPYATTVASPPAIPTCGAPCTGAQIASIDIANWLLSLSQRMSGGAGYVVANPLGGFDVTLTTLDPACNATPSNPGVGVRCYVTTFTP
jgi:type IV pilus assembly protein PilV